MDTVKVDLQKLQLLNDRISQTIDALNQVRLSTHGLQHSLAAQLLGQGGMQAQPQMSFGVQPQFGQVPFGAQPQIGQVPFGAQPQMGQVPYGAQPQIGQVPFGQVPITQGISHSAAPMFQQQQQQDPYWQYRLAQTFPYAAYQTTPIAW